ncbi:hypothetical protein GUJ93_ZPchr0458g22364 [Zizania palustris]|uniref:Uncharacterized protein n=1 Tax=Zizania palustris TaxID=103762 RepID=A0A8J5RRY9_ZIZPA|nr:hypothetical protein GUJ93_ZPchr0458g22364 [Zizania palustris]
MRRRGEPASGENWHPVGSGPRLQHFGLAVSKIQRPGRPASRIPRKRTVGGGRATDGKRESGLGAGAAHRSLEAGGRRSRAPEPQRAEPRRGGQHGCHDSSTGSI